MDLTIAELPSTWRWRATKAGLTLKQVSQLSGVQHSNLSKWGMGAVAPNFGSVIKVEKVLSDHGEVAKIVI